MFTLPILRKSEQPAHVQENIITNWNIRLPIHSQNDQSAREAILYQSLLSYKIQSKVD